MLTWSSETALRRAYFGSLLTLGLIAAAFHVAQNRLHLIGGEIAGAKLGWLAMAILFWFLLPALLMLDRRLSVGMRRAYRGFLANMLLRGLAELWMIYVALNWHPYYGIAHDLFSILLLQVLMAAARPWSAADRVLVPHGHVMSLMLVVEMGFAWYFYTRIKGDTLIYFVPDEDRYALILGLSWTAVAVLAAYLPVFTYRWLYATAR